MAYVFNDLCNGSRANDHKKYYSNIKIYEIRAKEHTSYYKSLFYGYSKNASITTILINNPNVSN